MIQISNLNFEMSWENPDFFNTLIGKLPAIRHYQKEDVIKEEISALEKTYSQFDFFTSDRTAFIKNIKSIVSDIKEKQPNWYGFDPYDLEECIQKQEFCLISGEGGIGKSYFIKCLEAEFERNCIPHLCVYGKFEKDIRNIDIDGIIQVADKQFIFIVDAINEMSDEGQKSLLTLLRRLSQFKNCRIIITYRTNSMDSHILDKLIKLANTQYPFQGVSYESALNELLKISVPDIYKYEDILYSNNALQLSMLCSVLGDKKLVDETDNSIVSITFILEYYIKKTIKRMFKNEISANDYIEVWQDTKRVASWMYEREARTINLMDLLSVVKSGEIFIRLMRQAGFLDDYFDGETHNYYFTIDSLTDFLIARSLFEDISEKDLDEQVAIIKQKVGSLYTLEEAVIIVLFDNFAPDYSHIMELLNKSGLIKSFRQETLIKINFKRVYISAFKEIFIPMEKSGMFTLFGGFTDKPFNCTNYLNEYFESSSNQLRELSSKLSGKHMLSSLKGRLKNIIYFLTINNGKDRRVEEAFYFALWCCAAPNTEVRCLAIKLLYEVLRQNPEYENVLINKYLTILDPYIKESIIIALSNCPKDNSNTVAFFDELVMKDASLSAKSIKRISIYLEDLYGYINWDRKNLYKFVKDGTITEELENILIKMNIMNKDFLPFKFWGKDHIDMYTKFLFVDKKEVLKLNNLLKDKYECVRTGDCNGTMVFGNQIKKDLGIDFKDEILDEVSFFCSFEEVIKKIFILFQESSTEIGGYGGEEEFKNSLFMKCIDIATGEYYGSLMCNYFTNQFGTYNNFQENIGYEVYDPLQYGEDLNITAPIPTYQGYIEKLGDIIISRIMTPEKKDVEWVSDAQITRKNLLSLPEPVKYKKTEWIMIAGRISLHEDTKNDFKWKDTYNIWCCTSEAETIDANGDAREVTIELDDYSGNIDEYEKYHVKPWLCKNVNNINHHSEIFDDASLVLPPVELISYFQLKPDYTDMSWVNKEGEKIILCNNNKASYYTDPIHGTVFIKKEYYDKYIHNLTVKFFAFTEKYIPETGYAENTSLHFEIQNNQIIKEILNDGGGNHWHNETNPLCANCPHGYNNKDSSHDVDMEELLQKLMENGYLPPELDGE